MFRKRRTGETPVLPENSFTYLMRTGTSAPCSNEDSSVEARTPNGLNNRAVKAVVPITDFAKNGIAAT